MSRSALIRLDNFSWNLFKMGFTLLCVFSEVLASPNIMFKEDFLLMTNVDEVSINYLQDGILILAYFL